MQTSPHRARALVAVIAASAGQGQHSIELHPVGELVVTPGHTDRIRVADLDIDGRLDLVLQIDSAILTSRNLGQGAFGPVLLSDANASSIYGFAVGNLNRDGRPDAVSANSNWDGQNLGIVLGNGDGSFRPIHSTNNGSGTTPVVAIGDVDGDLLGDVVSTGLGAVSVLLSRPGNRFSAPILSGGAGLVGDPLLSDLDADGDLDFVHLSDSGSVDFGLSRTYVDRGNGDGTFVHAQTLDLDIRVGSGFYTPRYVLADLDGDPLPDLVAFGFPGNHGGSGGLRLLRNLGGTFAVAFAETQGELGSTTIHVGAGDFDGDGIDDVLVLRKPNGTSEIRLSDGDFDFRRIVEIPTPFEWPWEAKAAIVADFVGSPLPDVLYVKVPGGADEIYALYENRTR